MRADRFAQDLADALVPALIASAEHLSALDGQVYALCLFCSSGCTSVGVAANTVADAADLDRLPLPALMNAPEWPHFVNDPASFKAAQALIDGFYDTLFDGEFDDVSFDEDASPRTLDAFATRHFCDAFVRALNRLRASGALTRPGFLPDVLLGLQYDDPGIADADRMASVSAQVNSATWHARVEAFCALVKTQLAR